MQSNPMKRNAGFAYFCDVPHKTKVWMWHLNTRYPPLRVRSVEDEDRPADKVAVGSRPSGLGVWHFVPHTIGNVKYTSVQMNEFCERQMQQQ